MIADLGTKPLISQRTEELKGLMGMSTKKDLKKDGSEALKGDKKENKDSEEAQGR